MDRNEGLMQNGQCLDTVRALHQTVVSLRQALEQSRNEILELKSKSWPLESVEEVLKSLSIENHLLRQKVVEYSQKGDQKKSGTDLLEIEESHSPKEKVSSPRKQVKIKSPEEIRRDKSKEDSAHHLKKSDTKKKCTRTDKSKRKRSHDIKDEQISNVKPDKTISPKADGALKLSNIKTNKSPDRKRKSPVSAELDLKLVGKQIDQATQDKENPIKVVEEHHGTTHKTVDEEQQKADPKKKVVDVKIDVTVYKKRSKDKKLSITIPPDILYAKEQSKIIPEASTAIETNVADKNIPEEEPQQVDKDLLYPERDFELSRSLGHSTLEKNEFEDICDDTEDDIDENSVYSNEKLNNSKQVSDSELPEIKVKSPSDESKEISSSEAKILITTENLSPRKVSKSLENLVIKKAHHNPIRTQKTLGFSKTLSYSNISDSASYVQSNLSKMADEKMNPFKHMNDLENDCDNPSRDHMQESQELETEPEVDEVELIFTTDETKEEDFKEELVSIDMNTEGQRHLQCPISEFEPNLSHESNLSTELEDDVFNDNFENENQENIGFQSQTFDFQRENSQLYNSKSDNSINHEEKSLRSYYSYQDSSFENKSLEKDESFDRFEERVRIIETDISKVGIHDVEYSLGRRNTCPNPLQYRPIIHREAMGKGAFGSRKSRPILAHSNAMRKESGAQTDISALPGSSWRSESNLVNKVKVGDHFTTLPSKYPMPGNRLRLSEKTVEARRVLLSDIGFTSMVPELSRSADHLCPPNFKAPVSTGTGTFGQFLRTPDLYSPGFQSQRFMWNNTTTPSDGSHSQSRYSLYPLTSPPVPTRRCSAPVSPSRKTTIKHTPSRVRFANGSLPELRGDWTTTIDSGDSTDSLVEEAEHYLRRSIDCIHSGRDVSYTSETCKGSTRRASAPEPAQDNVPPQGWQPFLPRIPRDLRLDHWVKVISPEGRVRGGRVRYVGPLLAQTEQFVGVQLSTPDGHSDGTYNNRRYFQCEPYHGIFVPFKKVVMGWRP